MGKIDLHTHTELSDGTLTPLLLVQQAKLKGVKVLSITDHDEVLGNLLAFQTVDLNGITLIPGIECTAKFPRGMMHICAYFSSLIELINNPNINASKYTLGDLFSSEILDIVDRQKTIRKNNLWLNSQKLNEQLKANGKAPLTEDEIESLISIPKVRGKHIQKYLLSKDKSLNPKEITAFFKLAKRESFPLEEGIEPEELLNIIKSTGAYSSLAHAKTLNLDPNDLRKEVHTLKEYGLDAIEVQHHLHNQNDRNLIETIAEEESLFISGGSDYHGEVKPSISLGTGGIGAPNDLTNEDNENYSINIDELSFVKEMVENAQQHRR